MSFGHAASTGGSCPCGSGTDLVACCGPLLAGAPALTAESLMRSRYTAFVVGDAAHLERTWHPRTRPDHVDIDVDLVWTGLEIDRVERGGAEESDGTVGFRAFWRDSSGRRGVLTELSRFERRGRRWMYLDGDVR